MFRDIKLIVNISIDEVSKYYTEGQGGRSIDRMNSSLWSVKQEIQEELKRKLGIDNIDNIKVDMEYIEI